MSAFRNLARSSIAVIALLFGARNTAAMPAAGETAPAFSLRSEEGVPVSLKDYRGKWVVLYFYPKDFTSGCTLEGRNFQRDSAKYAERDAVILGVSMDDARSHKDFCAKEGLAFKLLADTSGAVSKAYGSVMALPGKQLSARNTFLIDPHGKVARTWTKVDVAGHSEDVLKALDELRK
ncbi:MAG TPA: peroxiredoxin [Fibrobacteria bacterium]|jgi:peroxiredoxin Q/BCP|nr:peroxiredoxin [Fibrobacteria bacterium]